MKFIKIKNQYVIRLEKGEEIEEKLLEFGKEQNINSAFFNAIGAVLNAEIGFYNLATKEYIYKEITTPHEIVSLTGNITLVDDNPFLHMHCVLSSDTFECVGGHLKKATVGATCEIYLKSLDAKITRKQNLEIGLKLLDCDINP